LKRFFALVLIVFSFFSCARAALQTLPSDTESVSESVPQITPQITIDLLVILEKDPYLYFLVDKKYPLPSNYEPDDLIPLRNAPNISYRVNRNDLSLRREAVEALEEMAAAALREAGLTLVVSSTYRSYAYQTTVYNRYVNQYGRAQADRFSARPGHSQHQLGTAADFGSITNAFAETPEGRWIYNNASRFGWSLSYPQGYEEITGYMWESWHYRYVGKELAKFIDDYFEGIQQYALEYIFRFLNQNKTS